MAIKRLFSLTLLLFIPALLVCFPRTSRGADTDFVLDLIRYALCRSEPFRKDHNVKLYSLAFIFYAKPFPTPHAEKTARCFLYSIFPRHPDFRTLFPLITIH